MTEYSPWERSVLAQHEAAVGAARRAASIEAYRREWSSAGMYGRDIAVESWTRLPILSKDDLVEAARQSPPFGNRLGVARGEIAHIFAAPGPFYMPFTAADLDHVAGSFAKALAACGLSAGDVVDQTTVYNWAIAATALDRALRKVGCTVVPGGVGQSDRHIEVIAQLGIDAIVAFPTFLEHLLEQAAAGGHRLPLKKAAVMGELSDPNVKARLPRAHDITVREFYGTADVGAVAWECEAGEGMHLRDDLLAEFVSPGQSDPIEPGKDGPAEIVVTDFHRQAMPIIRMRTGDVIDKLVTGKCACGRMSPRFPRIVGRASEITKVKGVFVVPRQVVDVMQRSGVDRPFRLVVDRAEGQRDRLTLELGGEALSNLDAFRIQVEAVLRMRLDLRHAPDLQSGGPRLVDRRFAVGA